MKELIKKILREQDDMDSTSNQDLKTQDEVGGWLNPITDDSPGNVPPNSYDAKTYNGKTKRYYKPTITKSIFFKAVQLLSKMKDSSWFTQNEDPSENLWERQKEMSTPLKVLGVDNEGDGLTDKIYWAANDNREGLVDGSITNYDQLFLRPLIEYEVPLFESVREYKTIFWTPKVTCYSQEDAVNEVIYDEDSVYDSWEYDGDSSFSIDSEDWDSEGKELDNPVSVVKVVYPAEGPDSTVKESIKESLNEEMGPGPEENDIMSELQELVDEWYACEEGMEVACSYKNQVQEIIDRYKSKDLYEHSDNFTSHYDEPQIGDGVVNTNPGCVHYKSEGVIEDINDLQDEVGTAISYRVTNNGKSYVEGDILTKTPDQLEPLS